MSTFSIDDFLKDVDVHKMTVLQDDGVHRHLRFQNPETSDKYFEIVTFPGTLCYTGDMGTFVFSRTNDMFTFFRRNSEKEDQVQINPGYWAEKCLSQDVTHGVEKYSADRFRSTVKEWLDDMEASDEIRAAVEDEVLTSADEGEVHARDAAYNFSYEGDEVFQDFWETDLTEYTHHYLWCCCALSWAIEMYDQTKAEGAA